MDERPECCTRYARWLRHDPNCAVSLMGEGGARRWPVMLLDRGADHPRCDCGLWDAWTRPNQENEPRAWLWEMAGRDGQIYGTLTQDRETAEVWSRDEMGGRVTPLYAAPPNHLRTDATPDPERTK